MEEKIICNCCGKQLKTVNGVPVEEFVRIRKQWGYFSRKDGVCQEMCICEDCFDDWVKNFRVPAETTEATELM